jgi:hypothetical protein
MRLARIAGAGRGPAEIGWGWQSVEITEELQPMIHEYRPSGGEQNHSPSLLGEVADAEGG